MPVVVLAALMVVLLIAFVTFDSLVRIENAEHYDAWMADGAPWGFFWRPRGGGFAGTFSRSWIVMKWVFVTPSWVRADERARALLRRMRICVAVWNVGVLVFAIVEFTGSAR